MYFDEFVYITERITSELYFCVIDALYQYIPLVHNFFILRAHFFMMYGYIEKLNMRVADGRFQKNGEGKLLIITDQPNFLNLKPKQRLPCLQFSALPPPILGKSF